MARRQAAYGLWSVASTARCFEDTWPWMNNLAEMQLFEVKPKMLVAMKNFPEDLVWGKNEEVVDCFRALASRCVEAAGRSGCRSV